MGLLTKDEIDACWNEVMFDPEVEASRERIAARIESAILAKLRDEVEPVGWAYWHAADPVDSFRLTTLRWASVHNEWREAPVYTTPPALPEPIAWETDRGNGLIQYVTDSRYQKFSACIKRFYRPHTTPPALPVGIDDALRELSDVHGWKFVWARAQQLADGTKSCHKCHGDGLTHSSSCIHYNAAPSAPAQQAAQEKQS